jgi:hypothetical protein
MSQTVFFGCCRKVKTINTVYVTAHSFKLSLIVWGATEKASQFKKPKMTLKNKNFCVKEQNCIYLYFLNAAVKLKQ